MELFVKTEITLGWPVQLSQIHCQHFFHVCFFFSSSFSASHPKALRLLLHHRNPWPWPTMVTLICNQAGIPHTWVRPLSLRKTESSLLTNTPCHILQITELLDLGDFMLQQRHCDAVVICCWRVMQPRLLAAAYFPLWRRGTKALEMRETLETSGETHINGPLVFNCLQSENTVKALFATYKW